MQVHKIQNNNIFFKGGLWKFEKPHQVENEMGILNVQDVEYYKFKYDHEGENIYNAELFRFTEFNRDRKPVYNVRQVNPQTNTLPFTKREYEAYKLNPNADNKINAKIRDYILNNNLSENNEIITNKPRPKNFISLGTSENPYHYGSIILDEKAADFVTPLEREIIEISKSHTLSKHLRWNEQGLMYRVGVEKRPIRSENSFINYLNKLLGKEHPRVEKNVCFGMWDKNLQQWVYDRTETVKENVLQAFKQAAAESDSTVVYCRLNKFLKRLKK